MHKVSQQKMRQMANRFNIRQFLGIDKKHVINSDNIIEWQRKLKQDIMEAFKAGEASAFDFNQQTYAIQNALTSYKQKTATDNLRLSGLIKSQIDEYVEIYFRNIAYWFAATINAPDKESFCRIAYSALLRHDNYRQTTREFYDIVLKSALQQNVLGFHNTTCEFRERYVLGLVKTLFFIMNDMLTTLMNDRKMKKLDKQIRKSAQRSLKKNLGENQ